MVSPVSEHDSVLLWTTHVDFLRTARKFSGDPLANVTSSKNRLHASAEGGSPACRRSRRKRGGGTFGRHGSSKGGSLRYGLAGQPIREHVLCAPDVLHPAPTKALREMRGEIMK